ncbi:MAG: pyruvate kinase [Planctomycetota bacterium]
MIRRTKIVATLGPVSSSPEALRALLRAGVDVFRLNFSHDTAAEHRARIARLREASAELGREAAILQDLCGPKIRTGAMADGVVPLVAGREVRITTREELGTAERFSTIYPRLPSEVAAGNRILLDDGRMELEVLSSSADEVRCRVARGGMLAGHKGMNLPGAALSAPALTEKDRLDLAVGLEEGVDFVALSFVRRPDDLREARGLIDASGRDARLVAKIEKPEAVARIDAVLEAADGVMVARGDLGVEMDLARVALLQKEIIRKANRLDRYVITATQMLESMIREPAPTRAEVSDISNAILDGTDAVMLSGETAVGAFPVETVQMMDRVARATEAYLALHRPPWDWGRLNPVKPVEDAIGHAAFHFCRDLDIRAIVTYSESGETGLFLSKSRPPAPILALTANGAALRRMRLFWGVEPVLEEKPRDLDALRARALELAKERGLARSGETVLLVAGKCYGQPGAVNSIEVLRA